MVHILPKNVTRYLFFIETFKNKPIIINQYKLDRSTKKWFFCIPVIFFISVKKLKKKIEMITLEFRLVNWIDKEPLIILYYLDYLHVYLS